MTEIMYQRFFSHFAVKDSSAYLKAVLTTSQTLLWKLMHFVEQEMVNMHKKQPLRENNPEQFLK